MALAAELPTSHILAVDAMQVYRQMDIGTGKPSLADQRAIPHHGIDLVEPHELFTVSDFQTHAREVLASCALGQHPVIVVAGTGLYLSSIVDGLTLPGNWPEIRNELEQQTVDAVYARLCQLDPAAAAKIEPGNQRRLVRALEVCLGSGRSFSSFGPGNASYPAVDYPMIGIRWDRDRLASRVRHRVQQMIAAGWLDEVADLVASQQGLSRTAAQALGYKELAEVVRGTTSLEVAVEQTILRTRQFAVRQERWFRRDPRIRWIDVGRDPIDSVLPIVRGVTQ